MKRAIGLVFIFMMIVFAIVFVSKNNNKSVSSQRKTVVTTIYPLYFITKSIVGDTVEVKRLIKPGNEIHSFSPTPVEMVVLDQADLLITLGSDLEPWTQKLAGATSVEVLSLEEGLDLIHMGEAHHTEHNEHHHHSGINPHVWLDFGNDIKMVHMISERLSKLYPDHKAVFGRNASALQERFRKLQKSYADGLKTCSKKTLLVGHDAFAYLERTYGFKTESIMGIFAHSRPNAARVAALSEMIRARGIHYLFTDPIESSKSALQLATDMNLTLEPLYALGNLPLGAEEKGEDLISLLSLDLTQLRKGLECR